jgi:hypothetical protein
MAKIGEKLVRTTITLPASLKQRMDQTRVNWSQEIREMISERVDEEGEPDMAEAVILNERVKRAAPKDWKSSDVIKKWRRIRSS